MADKFADVLSDVAARSQFVVLGDTDHTDAGLIGFVGKREHMQALAQQGVKHFFFERDEGPNKVLKDYQDGKVGRDEMELKLMVFAPSVFGGRTAVPLSLQQQKDNISNMLETIDSARESGIRVHFIYNKAGTDELFQLNKALGRMDNKLIELAAADALKTDPVLAKSILEAQTRLNMGGNISADVELVKSCVNGWVEKLPEAHRQALHKEYEAVVDPIQRALGKARIDADVEIAGRMRAIAGDSKAAVFYGAGHGMHAGDLDDFLPNSTRVLVGRDLSSAGILRLTPEQMTDRGRAPDPKPADGIYIINEGKYVRDSAAGIKDLCSTAGVDTSKLSLCGLGEPEAPAAPEAAKPQLKQNTPQARGPNP